MYSKLLPFPFFTCSTTFSKWFHAKPLVWMVENFFLPSAEKNVLTEKAVLLDILELSLYASRRKWFFLNIIQIGNYSFNRWRTVKFHTTIKQDIIEVEVLFKRECFQPADKVLIFSLLSESHSYESNEFKLKIKHGKRNVKAMSSLNTINNKTYKISLFHTK